LVILSQKFIFSFQNMFQMKMNKMKQNDIMKAVDKLRFHYVTIIDLFGRKERAKKSPADNRWGFGL